MRLWLFIIELVDSLLSVQCLKRHMESAKAFFYFGRKKGNGQLQYLRLEGLLEADIISQGGADSSSSVSLAEGR